MKQQLTFMMLLSLLFLQRELLHAQASQGGGAYVDNSAITSSVVSNNQSGGAGSGVYATGTSQLVNNTIADNRQLKPFTQQVGDIYEGGIVFYVNPDARKGLIASLTEAVDTLKYKTWGEIGQEVEGAFDVENGKENTAKIIAMQVITPAIDTKANNSMAQVDFTLPPDTIRRAAHWCVETSKQGTAGWFLPSREQLKQLYVAKEVINPILSARGATVLGNGYYWSSTQASAHEAWYIFFDNGETNTSLKSNVANVRAIREFSY
jgi:hypothetical protein